MPRFQQRITSKLADRNPYLGGLKGRVKWDSTNFRQFLPRSSDHRTEGSTWPDFGRCGDTDRSRDYDFRAVIQRNVASSLSCSTSSTCSTQKPASLTICAAFGALRLRADADINPAVERSPALHDWRETSKNALKEAPKQSAAPTAAAPSKAARSDGPLATITEPMRDVATNPPVRATALFNPEAAPTWRASTDIRTAVVNGATAAPIPSAITTMAGRTPSQ